VYIDYPSLIELVKAKINAMRETRISTRKMHIMDYCR